MGHLSIWLAAPFSRNLPALALAAYALALAAEVATRGLA